MSNSVVARALSRAYNDHTGQSECIFKQLDFAADARQLTVVMGTSGTGKSTLLNMLALIDPIKEGELFFFDQPVHQLNERQRARQRAKDIGFIFQQFALIEEFSVRDNVAIPLVLNGESWRIARGEADNIIKTLIPDLNTRKHPRELSGGQQQRVAVARALVHKPRILIADEPTGNLDDGNAQKVRDLLFEIVQQYDITGIVVTHDIRFTEQADKFYSFEKSDDDEYKSKLVKKNESL
jgi:ABC-type lipoprotein export system ATPase subunit